MTSQGLGDLPSELHCDQRDDVLTLTLARPEKRNALNDTMIQGIERIFRRLPDGVRVVVLNAEGGHFCAGLDLAEMTERDTLAGVHHSRMWHRAFDAMAHGPVPVISVLKGAVIGGGLELAAATHIRVAEPSTFYGLPEGQRGLFVGGGASVRVPRLIGLSRMMDMMLTGRRHDADEGLRLGLSQYLVGDGEGSDVAADIAGKVASNAEQTNFAVLQALPRIASMAPSDGLFVESLMAAIAQGTDDAKRRMADFLAPEARGGRSE